MTRRCRIVSSELKFREFLLSHCASKMALAELCGLNNQFRFNLTDNFPSMDTSFSHYTGNTFDNCQLALPPFANPAENPIQKDEFGAPLRMHFEHGTTTLGFRYQGGVVICVDSRATGGSYIGSTEMKKIVEINDFLLGTLAGGAADCVYWDRVLSKQCRLYELRNRERISIAAASKLMSNMVYNYKGMGLSIGMMITGWDKRGSSLYYVDNDGTRSKGDVFSVGSGSVHAFGVLDSGYRWDLSNDEAFDLARRSIYHATFRDIASGGLIRVYHVTENGWKVISIDDSSDLHYKYAEERKQKS